MKRSTLTTYIICLLLFIVAAVAPVSASDWTTFQNDNHNTGVSADRAPITDPMTCPLSWEHQFNFGGWSGIDEAPLVAGDMVYAVGANNHIYAFNKSTGTPAWNKSTSGGGFLLGNAAVENGKVFVPTNNGKVFAFDAETGAALWNKTVSGKQLNTPITYSEGKIYFGEAMGGHKYYCLDEETGNEIWNRTATSQKNGQGSYYWAGAAVIGNSLVYGDDDGYLVSVNKSTGADIVEINVSTEFGVTCKEIRSSVLYVEELERIYFTSKGGYCYALGFNPAAGTFDTSDKYSANIGQSTSTPAYYNGRVYVGAGGVSGGGSGISCIDANLTDEIWHYAAGAVQSSPVVSTYYDDGDGEVYIYFTVNGGPGGIFCLKDFPGCTSPELAWSYGDAYKTAFSLAGPAISDGRVYFGTDKKYLFGLTDEEEQAPETPVAAFAADLTSGNAPLEVQFTDQSTGEGITAWAWDFDSDGNVDSTEQSPAYTYSDAGTYTVTLTVTYTGGSDVEEKADYITVNPGPINVKIRIEGNNYTIVPETELRLEKYNMTPYIEDTPEFPTPIYAICKVLEMNGKDCKNSDPGFSADKGAYIKRIDGLTTWSTSYDDGWMYYVNNAWAEKGVNAFEIHDGDRIDVFFTENYKDCTYSWFEEGEEITANTGEKISLLLNGSSYEMNSGETIFTPVEGASILINDTPYLSNGAEVLTDADGKATLSFDAPGTYIISATRYVSKDDPENIYGHGYIDINRPYCRVVVSGPDSHPSTFYDINLEASTFLGGSGYDDSYSSARDSEGNIYIALRSKSPELATTEGAYSSYNEEFDIYIAKFNPELSELLAATFLGGSGAEYEPSIAVDTSGNVYVAAATRSTDFPINEGAFQNVSAEEGTDLVLAKLDSDLKTLLASTYLGGNGYDYQSTLNIDAAGNVWIAGKTRSSDFPLTEGAFDNSSDSSGKWDAYLAKLDSGLTTLLASTYVGGDSGDDIIEGPGGNPISFDEDGNVFLTGHTRSESFPTTEGAYNTSFSGGRDAFVTKFNPELTELLASTYIAGAKDDYGIALVHSGNNVYVGGYTISPDFPTSEGAYQPELFKEYKADLFLAIFDEDLAELSACTYFGGVENSDYLHSMTLDEAGDVYISGRTYSKDFPVTEGAFNGAFMGGTDIFVSKIDGSLSELLGSTFLGGSSYDMPYNLIVDGNDVYVAGYTDSTDFPISRGAYQSEHNIAKDACLSRLSFKLCNTIEVNNGDDLQAAINSAAEDDKLLVHAGTYSGNVLAINKTLKIIGDGADKVTLDYGSVLVGKELLPDGSTNTLPAPDTVLEGLGFVNPSNTLVITSSSPGCTVRACSFEGVGINPGESILVESEYNLLENNVINGSEMAHITGNSNIFTANTVSNTVNEQCSLKMEGSNCQINRNTFKDSTGAGLCLSGKSENEVLENVFQANGIGLDMYGAGKDNIVALNNFIENEVNVADSGIAEGEPATVNTSWQTPETVSYSFKAVNHNGVLGNYYDDYTANDSDNNGIRDSALVHPASLGNEEYALVGPWVNGEIVVDYVLPEANFTVNVSVGQAPLTVQFTDLSENATSWKWDFDGDGNVDSTKQNPVHTYVSGGCFKVTLTVKNQDGSDTESRSNYIAAFGPYSSAAENKNPGAPDAGIPGFVGPDGDGKAGGNNYVNPAFVEWASGCVNYTPAAGVSSFWQSFSKALGPVKGSNMDIVSLGDLDADQIAAGNKPGEIILSFDAPICNGEGPDLAAFENGFISGGGAGVSGQLSAELAYMEVSTDGVNFVRFPSVSLTPDRVGGYGSIDPTNVYNLVGKHCNAYSACWGTPFDLEDLKNETEVTSGLVDLNEINYVKIVDIPGSGNFIDSLGNPIYDAWVTWGSGGLDLEAVGVLNAVVAPPNPTLSFEPSDLLVVDGQNGEIRLIADSFPNGLSGYNLSVEIEDPEIAEITGIEFPAWANPTENSSLPGTSVYLKVTDAPLNSEDETGTVKPGDGNVGLANISMLGKKTGTTNISITVSKMDDDEGNEIKATVLSGSLSVGTEAFPDSLCVGSPKDLNGDGIYEDITGNGECTFTDLELYFHYMKWIEENRPVEAFDFNGNGRIDFNDVVLMFKEVRPVE